MRKVIIMSAIFLAGVSYMGSGIADDLKKFEDPVFRPETAEPKTFEDPVFRPETVEPKTFEDPLFRPKTVEPKAIWGTDGAAITKQDPKIAPILPTSIKPVVPLKQPVNTATDIKEAPAPIIPTTATDKLRDDPWAGSQ